MIPGRFSEIERQIDVAGRSDLLGQGMLGIVDCKCYSKRVDVNDVEAVIGMAADVRADIAVIVTTIGYTDAAKARANNDPNIRIHLDIITPEEAKRLGEAPAAAMMYRGKIGAIVLAPSGWMAAPNKVSGKQVLPLDALCYFHPNNLSGEEALRQAVIGWCQIEDNPDKTPDHLLRTLELQNAGAYEHDPQSEIETWHEPLAETHAKAIFRRIDYKRAGYVDFTFFVDLEDNGLFWACIACRPADTHHALNRLRFVANSVRLVFAPNADPNQSQDMWQNFFPWRKQNVSPESNDDSG